MLRGFLSVDDRQASELVLQDLLEQIAALLRPVHTVGVFDRVGPLQIEEVAHSRIGQTHLCHCAMRLPVEVLRWPRIGPSSLRCSARRLAL